MGKGRDDIERLILDNLDGLNDSEPAEGHFERFEAKLKKQSPRGKSSFSIVWKMAAAAVFIFLAVNQAVIYFSPEGKKVTSLGSISPEYREVEFYYTNSIDEAMEQWKKMSENGYLSEEDKAMMEDELNDFDKAYSDLQKELKANPDDERVINAMLEYYQDKLNVITMIITKLKEEKSQKEAKHEIKI
jgi:tetratricopeptide (TPR) repeat protein